MSRASTLTSALNQQQFLRLEAIEMHSTRRVVNLQVLSVKRSIDSDLARNSNQINHHPANLIRKTASSRLSKLSTSHLFNFSTSSITRTNNLTPASLFPSLGILCARWSVKYREQPVDLSINRLNSDLNSTLPIIFPSSQASRHRTCGDTSTTSGQIVSIQVSRSYITLLYVTKRTAPSTWRLSIEKSKRLLKFLKRHQLVCKLPPFRT